MRSLSVQLLIGTAVGMVGILLLSGLALDALFSQAVRDRFDRELLAKAQSLATLLEEDHGDVEFEALEKRLPEFEPSERADFYQVWWPDGAVYARSPSLEGENLLPEPVVSERPVFDPVVLAGDRSGRVVTMQAKPFVEYTAEDGESSFVMTLSVGRATGEVEAFLARVRQLLIAVGAGAVVLSSVLLAGLIQRNLRPVRALAHQIGSIGIRDLSKRVDDAGVPQELGPVVERLNELLGRLGAAFERERRFTGDVAHELRTPLAGLRSTLELGLTRERSSQEYQQSLHDCLGIDLHMQRLVESLLQLARADGGQLTFNPKPTQIDELLRTCWAEVSTQAAERGLTVEWNLDVPERVVIDADSLRLIVQNLLENAVTYAEAPGRIEVTLKQGEVACSLEVGNAAKMTADDAARVFDRFWRADKARTPTDETRCGLGLALCKALAEQMGGEISANLSGDGWFVVQVNLPSSGRMETTVRGTLPVTNGSRAAS
jgi:two-component system heavy metal sensor histidine kinase CusS